MISQSEGFDLSLINAASIDITLGSTILMEEYTAEEEYATFRISLRNRDQLRMKKYYTDKERPFILKPGDFILAHSEQVFHLPNDVSAYYTLKSSMARIGLNHAHAGWCDAGWNGSALTLELMNCTQNHEIELHMGDKIGQMLFFRHAPVPNDKSYAARGRYNGDKTVSGIKK